MMQGWIVGAAAAALGMSGAAGSPTAGLSFAPASAVGASYRLSSSGTGMRLTLGGRTLQAATSTVSAGSGIAVDAVGTCELSPGRSRRGTRRSVLAARPGPSRRSAQRARRRSSRCPTRQR